jgi:hypothetical protein
MIVSTRSFAPLRQLIVHEVHRPGLIRSRRRSTVLPQLGLDPALGRFVAYLQAHLPIQAIDPLGIDPPAFTAQQYVNAPITVANPGGGDLLDPFGQLSLPGSTGAVVVGRSFDRQRTASTSNAHSPGRARMIHHLPLSGRLQNFRRITSCSIALSSDRSAPILFSLPFSSSS